MAEIIQNIEFVYYEYDGVVIITNEQEIQLQISNAQSCCENWGFFVSEDNLNDFIGAEIFALKVTDTELNTKMINQMNDIYLDEGGVMFVDIITDKGVFQFAAYNAHNGYYGHNAKVVSKQLNYEISL